MMDVKQKLLRVSAVSERLCLKESTIRKMIFEKRLPVVRIGRTVTIPEKVVDKIISDGYSPALPERQ